MPHCTKCGTAVADASAFCPNCGAAQAGPGLGAAPGGPAVSASAAPGLSENVAGLLCYAALWVTGLVFFLVDKRPFVRYHAAQSMVIFGGLHILRFVVKTFFGASLFAGAWTGFSVEAALLRCIDLAVLILWIVCMVKAHQGERFRVPVAADLAENIFGKS
jgi:uncharacterized membrane protein